MASAAHLIDAQWVGSTFSAQPDLELPSHPRIIPELLITSFDESGILFEGANDSQIVKGGSARSFLPLLLPKLDGKKSIEEIQRSIPSMPPGAIRDCIALLFSRGLLEDGCPAAPPPHLREVDAFLGRHIDLTRANANRGEAMARLAMQRLAIDCPPDFEEIIAEQLTSSGIGHVASWHVTSGKDTGDRTTETDLMVSIGCGEEGHADAINAALAKGIRVFHAHIGTGTMQIGPLFVPGVSACFECMRRLHPSPTGTPHHDDFLLWASLAVQELILVLSRIASPRLLNAFQQLEKSRHSVSSETRYIARIAGCTTCGTTGSLTPDSPGFLAWLLHNSVVLPPRELCDPRAFQQHFAAANIVLTKQPKERFTGGSNSHGLPVADPLDAPAFHAPRHPRRSSLSLEGLSAILQNAAGRQQLPDGSLRWIAPTGGSLASVELFVAACDVAGLQNGIYHYNADDRALEQVRRPVGSEFDAVLSNRGQRRQCTVIGVADIGRVHRKYNNFSYPIVHLDAGIALGYIHEMAAALDIPIEEHSDTEDRLLAGELKLPGSELTHCVTFAASLGGALATPETRGPETFSPRALKSLLTLASSMPFPVASTNGLEHPPAAEPSAQTLGRLMLDRRSVRGFAAEPIGESTLTRIARLTLEMRELRSHRAFSPQPVELWIALRIASDGMEPGAYRAQSDGALEFIRPGFDDSAMSDCVSQKNLGSAAGILVVTGDFDAACCSRGARGYRELLISAGAAVGRAWLAATSLDLGACASAGFLEEGIRRHLGIDGYRQCPFFSLAIGRLQGFRSGERR